MNWLLIVVLGILVFYALKGRRDGFIMTVFTLFSLVIALFLTMSLSPYISKTLQNNDKVYQYAYEAVSKVVTIEKEDKPVTKQVEDIEGLSLPRSLKEALIENNNPEVYKALAINNFKDYVNNYLAVVVINGFSFILTFILINIAMMVLANTLNILSKLPIINGLNKSAGLIVGILKGLIIIWVLCIILTTFSGSSWAQEIFKKISESRFLTTVYDNNLLLNAITNMAKILF